MKPAKDSTLGKEKHTGTEAARSAPNPPTANKPSPDARGVERNLPAVFAGGALHPPVAPTRSWTIGYRSGRADSNRRPPAPKASPGTIDYLRFPTTCRS